jgi:hypothetical protein
MQGWVLGLAFDPSDAPARTDRVTRSVTVVGKPHALILPLPNVLVLQSRVQWLPVIPCSVDTGLTCSPMLRAIIDRQGTESQVRRQSSSAVYLTGPPSYARMTPSTLVVSSLLTVTILRRRAEAAIVSAHLIAEKCESTLVGRLNRCGGNFQRRRSHHHQYLRSDLAPLPTS